MLVHCSNYQSRCQGHEMRGAQGHRADRRGPSETKGWLGSTPANRQVTILHLNTTICLTRGVPQPCEPWESGVRPVYESRVIYEQRAE